MTVAYVTVYVNYSYSSHLETYLKEATCGMARKNYWYYRFEGRSARTSLLVVI